MFNCFESNHITSYNVHKVIFTFNNNDKQASQPIYRPLYSISKLLNVLEIIPLLLDISKSSFISILWATAFLAVVLVIFYYDKVNIRVVFTKSVNYRFYIFPIQTS